MVLWFAGLSWAAAWAVFKDPAVDYRLVVVGSLLPLLDVLLGAPGPAHTLAGSVVLLAVTMLGTRHRRRLRRHLLALPIGTFLHLVLDGAWADRDVFWWPAFGVDLGGADLGELDRGWLALPMEAVGAVALAWAWRRFRLAEPERRATFLRTGRIGRDLVS